MAAMSGTVAVVINVGTDLVATLALASLRRHAPDIPVRLINCDASTESREHFDGLRRGWGFQVVEQATSSHGRALDELFEASPPDLVLLLDSDAEVLSPNVVPRCLSYFDNPKVFGAGFTNGPGWLGPDEGHGERVCYYQERPWMPFVVLRTVMVKEALRADCTFQDFTVYNDVAVSQRLSRLLAARFPGVSPRSSRFANLPKAVRGKLGMKPLNGLAWLRGTYYGQRPNYVYYDTGASIYQYCKYEREWLFAGDDFRLHSDEVAHYHGVTRSAMYGSSNATALMSVAHLVRQRLEEYGLGTQELSSLLN